MQINLKIAAAAVALALGSSATLAADLGPTGPIPTSVPLPSTSNSGVVFSLFSTVDANPYSYSFFLGLTVDDLTDGASVTPAWNADGNFAEWDLSGIALPAGLNLTQARWHVTAADLGTVAGDARILTTVASTVTTPLTSNGLVATATQRAGNYFTALNSNAGNPDITTDTTSLHYADDEWGTRLNTFGFDAGQLLSNSNPVNMYLFTNNGGTGGTNNTANTVKFAGQWTFNLQTGVLRYETAPVPLPAAAWLMLSGLAGLGVIGRRRRTA